MNCRHRLRRVPLHRVARVAQSVPQHGLPQRRAGRRRGAESLRRRPTICGSFATTRGRENVVWQLGCGRRLLPWLAHRVCAPRAAGARHARIALVKDGPDVLVRDSVEGRGSRELVWRFHLAPAVDRRDRWRRCAPSRGRTRSVAAARVCLRWLDDDDRARLDVPTYGVRAATRVVTLQGRAVLPQVVSFRFGLLRTSLDRLRGSIASMPAGTRTARLGKTVDHVEVG